MSAELVIGVILVGCSLGLFAVTLAIGVPAVAEFFAGMFVLAIGLALILYGLPYGAVAMGVTP